MRDNPIRHHVRRGRARPLYALELVAVVLAAALALMDTPHGRSNSHFGWQTSHSKLLLTVVVYTATIT